MKNKGLTLLVLLVSILVGVYIHRRSLSKLPPPKGGQA